jgi:hypothetical protein
MDRQAIAELAARRARPARRGWVRRRGRSGLSELLVERVERRELVGQLELELGRIEPLGFGNGNEERAPHQPWPAGLPW